MGPRSVFIAIFCLVVVLSSLVRADEQSLEFDYVIAGGGGAGAALAGKLARAGKSVLLLEYGDNTQYDPNIALAMGYFGSYNQRGVGISSDTEWVWPNVVQADKGSYGAKNPATSGKGLGGGTSVNMMDYFHGGKWMYDFPGNGWPASWSYDSMKPIYEELDNTIKPYRAPYKQAPNQVFLKAAKILADGQYAAGGLDYLVNAATYAQGPNVEDPAPSAPQLNQNDIDGVNSVVAFSQLQFFVNQLPNGTFIRRSSASVYLGPDCLKLDGTGTVQCPRLTVFTGAYVDKVIISSTTTTTSGKGHQNSPKLVATGVHFYHEGQAKTATASKYVIVAAGTFQTPGILQRSGYGNSTYLSSLGIQPVYNNPQVGLNLKNHFSPMFAINVLGPQAAINQFMTNTSANGGNLGFGAAAMLTYSKYDPNRLSDSISLRKYQFMVYNSGSLFSQSVGASAGVGPSNQTLLFSIDDIHFDGSGYIQIPTKNPFDFPDIFFNTFVDYSNDALSGDAFWAAAQSNISATIAGLLGYNIGYEVYTTMKQVLAAEGSAVNLSLAFPTESDLALLHAGIVRHGASDWWKYLFSSRIITKSSSQEDIDFAAALQRLLYQLRSAAHVDSHQCGTSKMGEVVDDTLSVIGVDNLKIADASIMPRQSGGNTGGTAFAIGLRAYYQLLSEEDS